MSDWWCCPNGRCEHGAVFHDVWDDEDPMPRCCVDGCTCGRRVAADTPKEPAWQQDHMVTTKTSDIVERLRANRPTTPTKDRYEAADEIELLRAQVRALQKRRMEETE